MKNGPSSVPCQNCHHVLGDHDRSENRIDAGRCLVAEMSDFVHECHCQRFVWEVFEEDPDALWNDYKDGYVDIDGNYLEPSDP